MNTLSLIISNTSVKQDSQQRFCLNDLHKAAGNNPSQKPSEWLRNKQTIALTNEFLIEGIPAIKVIKGRGITGTYAVKELVYAYAMWISPSFHLKVIRAYDALVTQPSLNLTDHQVDQIVKQLSLKLGESLRFGVRRNWTAEEDSKAIELKQSGLGCTRIGYQLGRSPYSVYNRFKTRLYAMMQAIPNNQIDLFEGGMQ